MPDDDYKKYEQDCARVKEENTGLLADFRRWLSEKGITKKTVDHHVRNVDIYINDFMLYDDATPAKEGVGGISMFLGYWFIRKAAWASPSAIRQNAVSLKKFYTFMREKGEIDAEALNDLKETIKEEMPEWMATMRRYDDPDITEPGEIWGL
ncbi:MAG: hypothetical protein ACLQNE_26960 [Thermoguttaceae bacterium]